MIKGHTLLEAKGRGNNWSHSRDRGKERERERDYRVVSETGKQIEGPLNLDLTRSPTQTVLTQAEWGKQQHQDHSSSSSPASAHRMRFRHEL
ncbi:hypothetical protein EYF80_019624 [Liparis tanakae]|uniref:Uncharacterized protein n=1 Tax=Liparis tanakae TaxID=230148 RepID=A0A4Z2HYP4_9TELE|nr:hypothetical protein EYF80_019624 [Liparis tanakae]